MNDEIENQLEEKETKRKMGFGSLVAWILLFAFFVVLGMQLFKNQQGYLTVGEEAPLFTLETYEGTIITPEDMEGKVVLVNFWASFCISCKDEARELEEAWQFFKDRGDVLFLGVAWSDTTKAALGYIEEYGITYFNGPDLKHAITDAYRMDAVPETYVFDKNGIITATVIGPFSRTEQIILVIESALGN